MKENFTKIKLCVNVWVNVGVYALCAMCDSFQVIAVFMDVNWCVKTYVKLVLLQ
jgi:hypothetical protein